VRTGFTVLALGLVIGLMLVGSAFGDYTLVGKIPAPQPEMSTCPVTGLESAGDYLFVTVRSDTSSDIYLIRPSDGLIMDSYHWDLPFGEPYAAFTAGAHAEGIIYWAADQSGKILKFEFDDASVYLHGTFENHRITAPTGLAWQDMGPLADYDALWIADSEVDSLYLMQETGTILESYSLSDLAYEYGLVATSVTRAGDNLFFTSGNYTDSLFEATQTAGRVDAYHLGDTGFMDLESSAFHDGLLYVGGYGDSILVYSAGSYADSVPTGDSVVVHVIPNELDVGFAHVGEAGSLFVDVSPGQSCPPPEGVDFFGDFYDISTTATFDYITKVALTEEGEFPAGVRSEDVRVFVRPSGECETWRDITVEMLEVEGPRSPVLARTGKRLSEDDEFSVFTFGEDTRSVKDVVVLKFDYLDSAITQNQDSIPSVNYIRMASLLDRARTAFGNRRYGLAALRADRIADIAVNTPEIPHTYDPDLGPGRNIAGRIISRAHTLSFSLRLMIREEQMGNAAPPPWKGPDINIIGQPRDRVAPVPNPSSSAFVISFTAGGRDPVSISVYSVEGRLVSTLVEGEHLTGAHAVTWDGRNDQGIPVAAGTYFAVVREGERTTTQKLILKK
jgi:hypothetical protein